MNKPFILTPQQRDEIRRRLKDGEKQTALAGEFGVTRQAISLIKKRMLMNGVSARFGRYLTDAEQAEFKTALETTVPADHGLAADLERDSWVWTQGRAHALAEKLFKDRFRKYPITKLLKSWYPDNELWAIGPGESGGSSMPARGQAANVPSSSPVRRRRKSIDPEFEAFLNSPLGKKIQAGAIGSALDVFEKRIKAENPDAVIEHIGPSVPSGPSAFPRRPAAKANIRIGKHKGSNSRSAKKQKKSKRK